MRFTSQSIDENAEVPLADEGRWEALRAQYARRHAPAKARDPEGNACYVVSVNVRGETADAERKLEEILGLVRARGDRVVGHEIHRLGKPEARTFLGRGASAEIAERALDAGADMLVLDAELSPSQTRNLEDAAGLPICDREAVILEVFQKNARTRRAKIQVEVAELEYLRPRIRGMGLEMDQQAGGVMYARGPGETASELLARRLDGRLADLRRALAKLSTSGELQRSGRGASARLALVGYTNAGKTSLMNALTGAGLSAKDSPFETLDTTSRCLARHGGDVVLSDTVGFIRRLPERLLASFESTLAEVRDATLLVLVVDLSDPEWPLHLATTDEVLVRLGAATIPRHYVFNKIDRVPAPNEHELRHASAGHEWTALSTRDAGAVAELRRALLDRVRSERRIARVFVPHDSPELQALVHGRCRVLATDAGERGMRVTIEAEPQIIERIKRHRKEAV
jgi:GTP-binding protein HflX